MKEPLMQRRSFLKGLGAAAALPSQAPPPRAPPGAQFAAASAASLTLSSAICT